MATSAIRADSNGPVEYKRADGFALICSCGSSEFRVIEEPLHLFCRCGLIYTEKDLQDV